MEKQRDIPSKENTTRTQLMQKDSDCMQQAKVLQVRFWKQAPFCRWQASLGLSVYKIL